MKQFLNVRTSLLATLSAMALVGASMPASAASVLTNGSFESPNIGTGNYTYAPSGTGWAFSGSALVNAQGANAWYGGSAPSGMNGVQFAALQGLGSLSQSFTATASTLHLGWLDAGRPNYGCCNGDQSYNVLLNGSAVGGTFSTVSGESFGFNTLDFTGLTVGLDYNLAFQGLINADQTSFIDGVVLSDTPVAAPAGPPIVTLSALGDPNTLPSGQALIADFNNPATPNAVLQPNFSLALNGATVGVNEGGPGYSGTLAGNSTHYLTIPGNASTTLTSLKGLKNFSFYMGSPDSYNSVQFLGENYDFTLSGGQLTGGNTNQSWNWASRVNFDFGGAVVNTVILRSSGNSFEVDNFAGMSALAGPSGAVPEPATWAMMIIGFGAVGAIIRRRKLVFA